MWGTCGSRLPPPMPEFMLERRGEATTAILVRPFAEKGSLVSAESFFIISSA